MVEMIYYVIMFSFFLNFSFGCIEYSNINRAFSLMYRGLFETALATIDERGNPGAHFNEEKIEEYIPLYIGANMPKYVTSYTINYYYFDEETGLVCTSHFCKALKISIKAHINYFFDYEKAMNFYVKEGKGLEY